MCLFGENNNSSISGIWVWKGHDLAFELSDDWKIDYTSYDWQKLDPNSEETKTMVNNYLKWVGEDKEGRKFNQGKIFK
jgi:elongation factor 1-gamma